MDIDNDDLCPLSIRVHAVPKRFLFDSFTFRNDQNIMRKLLVFLICSTPMPNLYYWELNTKGLAWCHMILYSSHVSQIGKSNLCSVFCYFWAIFG